MSILKYSPSCPRLPLWLFRVSQIWTTFRQLRNPCRYSDQYGDNSTEKKFGKTLSQTFLGKADVEMCVWSQEGNYCDGNHAHLVSAIYLIARTILAIRQVCMCWRSIIKRERRKYLLKYKNIMNVTYRWDIPLVSIGLQVLVKCSQTQLLIFYIAKRCFYIACLTSYMFRSLYRPSSDCTLSYYKANYTINSVFFLCQRDLVHMCTRSRWHKKTLYIV